MLRWWSLVLVVLLCTTRSNADAPAFDLTGPKVDVHVKRGEVTLPIGQTPNLLPGDRLWIHPDLPESQSTHFVLVVAFLRGITNPPPPEWFTRVETWSRSTREEGVFVTVPEEAQQALIFLAPETGGDFSTLRAAVRGRPGAFVRATQDLQAASWDRMRLDAYLVALKVISQGDAAHLKERAEKAAATLGVRLDKECFDKPTDQQAPCLTQHTDGMVLDDANTQGMITQLANGAAGDLMNQISNAPSAGAGLYSPYVGAVLDIGRILSSLHTAHFQYIPALALPQKDTLNLRLNFPPSFRDPKSVVVVALPPVGPAKPPALHPADPGLTFCATRPSLALFADGAPLVFATQMAHSLTLHIETTGKPIDLPVVAEAANGGLVFQHQPAGLPGGELTGVVRGKWGFDDWEGPRFELHSPVAGKWAVPSSDQLALIVGREDTLHLEDENSVCVEKVEKAAASGDPLNLAWKAPKPQMLEVAMPMKDASPGPVTVEIRQYGLAKPDKIELQAYAEAASLKGLSLSSGDGNAELMGTRLDEVEKATLNGITFTPAGLSRVEDYDKLGLKTSDSTAGLESGKNYIAEVELRDGRKLKAPVTVDPPRPQVALMSKGVQDEANASPSPIHLGSADDLPVEGRLVFFLKSRTPTNFPRTEKVEVSSEDGSFKTLLSVADGSLILEDAETALGVIDPLVKFGSSAFGPLRARPVSSDGATGDWLALGTLVREPGFNQLKCPRALAKPCMLNGSNLFLTAAISSTPDFDNAVDVPQEFTGTQLSVPHPVNGVLYLKLRDDPETVQTLTMPVTPVYVPTSAQAAPAPTAPAAPTTQNPAATQSSPPAAQPTAPAAAQATAPPAGTPANPPASPPTAQQTTPAKPEQKVPNP
jgi:hypothetical protein